MTLNRSISDICVIGGGPAGLEAAVTASRCGAKVILVDDHDALGGQIWRPKKVLLRAAYQDGDELVRSVRASNVRVVAPATAFDAEPGIVWVTAGGSIEEIGCRQIIVAAGAADTAVAVPGWTLPGVMTAGGLHALVFGQGVVPTGRVVIAGTGPLLLAFSAELAEAGVNITLVAEAAPFPSSKAMARLVRQSLVVPSLIPRAAAYSWQLKRRRIPIRSGLVLRLIEGDAQVRGVVLSPCDAQWRPIPGRDEYLPADLVCIGYGLSPSDELLRRVGCQLRDERVRGGLIPRRTPTLETDVKSVYAAGDGAGVRGVETARIEGRIAGMAAAAQIGPGTFEERSLTALLRRHRRLIALRDAIDDCYPMGQLGLARSDGTVVCRCEAVTAERVAEAVIAFDGDSDAVKGYTRAGMGRCQGRNCSSSVRDLSGGAGAFRRVRVQGQVAGTAGTGSGFGTRRPFRRARELPARAGHSRLGGGSFGPVPRGTNR